MAEKKCSYDSSNYDYNSVDYDGVNHNGGLRVNFSFKMYPNINCTEKRWNLKESVTAFANFWENYNFTLDKKNFFVGVFSKFFPR